MRFVRVARVSEVPPGQVRVFQIGDEGLAVCNVDGVIYAVADLCTHDGGPLGAGTLTGNEIECPRHGARFDVQTGAVKALPAIIRIPTFKVRIEGDDILVAVD